MSETERQFQDKVIAMAIMYGWKAHHVRPGMNSRGRWMTHVQGHIGFPDLVLVHQTRGLIFCELKTDRGRISPEQSDWLQHLTAAGSEVYVWRPKDFPFIVQRLAGTHKKDPDQ